ncbi:Deoxyguanosine kinase [Paramuricea clavata]|uniref:Deoxyguanosine kinase n=2 Tax=Paramuricea clavata TaxID=317549 RepID=A0A6S7I4Y0_PARCT|nr:Deoxyguanosine kinase [Paramuricea clavata]
MIGLKCARTATISKVMPPVETSRHKSPAKQGHVIIVEGNIGVGKTTLTCQLGRKLNYRIFLEPTSRNPYLTKFYNEPKKYALKMQLWLFRQRCMMYMRAVKHAMKSGQGVLLDRSLFSDHVFATVSHGDGNISNEGYKRYCRLRSQMLKLVPFPDVVVYLNAVPQECHNRITKRGRGCESGIPIQYLLNLQKNYGNLLDEMRRNGSEIMTYDWSEFGFSSEVDKDIKNFENVRSRLEEERYEEIQRKILDIFNTDANMSDETFSEDEIDDDELLEQEKRSHSEEHNEQLRKS